MTPFQRPEHWHPVVAETDPITSITEKIFVAVPDVIVIERSRPIGRHGRAIDRRFYPWDGVKAFKTEDEARSQT